MRQLNGTVRQLEIKITNDQHSHAKKTRVTNPLCVEVLAAGVDFSVTPVSHLKDLEWLSLLIGSRYIMIFSRCVIS